MKIDISNLSDRVTEEDLRRLFSALGRVTTVQLNPSKGSAIVEMPDDNRARAAIKALKGRNLQGKPLKIDRPKGTGEKQEPRRHASDRKGGARGGR